MGPEQRNLITRMSYGLNDQFEPDASRVKIGVTSSATTTGLMEVL